MTTDATPTAPGDAVRIERLNKWFGGNHALRDVSVTIRRGEIHAVVGENGAGKSTLMKVMAGIVAADTYEGQLSIGDRAVAFSSVADAERAGVAMVPQELSVVPDMSIADNLFLNHEHRSRGLIDWRSTWSATRRWTTSLGLDVDPLAPMAELTTGQQQLVSIARALSQGAQVLILDEPTVSLTETESGLLFAQLERLRADDVTILYVSHRLAEVAAIADRVTVMRDGAVVDELDPRREELVTRKIVRAMLGRDMEQLYPPLPEGEYGEVMFELERLSVANQRPHRPPLVDDLSLSCRAGEIVGVFGAVGSGTNVLARAIFGTWPGAVEGSISVEGRPTPLHAPADAIAAGIAYVSSERREGLVPEFSVAENMSLVALGRPGAGRLIDRRWELSFAQEYMRRFKIRAMSSQQLVTELSGGTQQKVVLAKWLAVAPKVLILEEPTQGIDVGVRAELYELLASLVAEGSAVILISSDLHEVVGMSHRGIVIRKGRSAGTWSRETVSEERLLHMATTGDME